MESLEVFLFFLGTFQFVFKKYTMPISKLSWKKDPAFVVFSQFLEPFLTSAALYNMAKLAEVMVGYSVPSQIYDLYTSKKASA